MKATRPDGARHRFSHLHQQTMVLSQLRRAKWIAAARDVGCDVCASSVRVCTSSGGKTDETQNADQNRLAPCIDTARHRNGTEQPGGCAATRAEYPRHHG